ncbi:MAG: hypothetical protein FJZ00_05355 [Candidatus Sericytochromatia bacterium]|uniref:Uncharacterized protein n=1 Tax=Candidatus Tanganyikabacteria bacterium TaxID=2961651 RepID=A0A937X564_9BACT|nr:hypothetical protein [Candidatus Tanganyikabacteria bacterium]
MDSLPEIEKRLQQWKKAAVERPGDRFAKEEFFSALKDMVAALQASAPSDDRIPALKRAANALSEELFGRTWFAGA